ncbi:uncharacterized protein LOC133183164 [Saccostrea echinata]|uniref:uncharacterized protein LOC133183164 n=1 Tax=Saccostrea echinata TaxID=191078 RepID=UPI002A7EEFF2|nr:uncharacterized protein LOC133183164 [Saccostrea echinata]
MASVNIHNDQEKGSQTEIPCCTSKWSENHLNILQVFAVQSRAYPPAEILSYLVDEGIERRVRRVKEHLMHFMPAGLKAVDFDDFYSINHGNCKSILYNAQKRQMLSFRLEPLPDFAEEAWRESFRVHGELFCKQLIFMTWQKERGVRITEYMFQQLFQHFTAMFGLHAIAVPCLLPQSMTVGSIHVNSTPDLIFYDLPNCDQETSKIFAICKVKRKMESDTLEPSPPKTRKLSEKERKEITHLDADTIGQHGGELLVHYASTSSKQPVLFGFIVQDTNVTFTQFSCSEVDYEVIKRGGDSSFPKGAGPMIKFSKPYNILKAEDRMHIIEPFLKLGFFQSTL